MGAVTAAIIKLVPLILYSKATAGVRQLRLLMEFIKLIERDLIAIRLNLCA